MYTNKHKMQKYMHRIKTDKFSVCRKDTLDTHTYYTVFRQVFLWNLRVLYHLGKDSLRSYKDHVSKVIDRVHWTIKMNTGYFCSAIASLSNIAPKKIYITFSLYSLSHEVLIFSITQQSFTFINVASSQCQQSFLKVNVPCYKWNRFSDIFGIRILIVTMCQPWKPFVKRYV